MASNSAPTVDRIRIIPRPDDFLDRNFGNSGEVSNGLVVAAETTLPLHLRCTKLYFNNRATNANPAGDSGLAIQVRAGLTTIDASEFDNVIETFLEANN